MQKKNTKLKKNYTQVVIWPATYIAKKNIKDFEKWVKKELGARCQFLEVIATGPGQGGLGGRDDLFFAIHDDDVAGPFSIKRLQYGMRWLDDAVSHINGGNQLYPGRVTDYQSWDGGSTGPEPQEDNEHML